MESSRDSRLVSSRGHFCGFSPTKNFTRLTRLRSALYFSFLRTFLLVKLHLCIYRDYSFFQMTCCFSEFWCHFEKKGAIRKKYFGLVVSWSLVKKWSRLSVSWKLQPLGTGWAPVLYTVGLKAKFWNMNYSVWAVWASHISKEKKSIWVFRSYFWV